MVQASNQRMQSVQHLVLAFTRKASIMKRGEHKRKLSPTIFTVGHSSRTLEAFIGLFKEHSVKKVVDIRTIPRSRHNPQFNRERLPEHHQILHHIAGAMEAYGESAVFHVVARFGDYTEIIASFNIETGKKLQRIARYHTRDGMKFSKKE